MKIGILIDGFIGWGGGIDFIRLIIKALKSHPENDTIELKIIYAEEQVFGSELERKIKKIAKKTLSRLRFTCTTQQTQRINKNAVLEAFCELISSNEVLSYSGSNQDLEKLCTENEINCLIPSIRPLPRNFQVPWIGYIFDFQHKYYPVFFTYRERLLRNIAFRRLLTRSKLVIVNAQAVKDDCEKYFPNSAATVKVLPFTPVCFINLTHLPKIEDVLKKYNLPPKYFIISNQFWVHKDHETAIKAFGILANEWTDVGLVCTGSTFDPRAPDLIKQLSSMVENLNLGNKVFFLGRIPKSEQIQLMKNSVCVVQPTLFEGGPGGGQVFEAIALGKKVIITDLPVNREINQGQVEFFPIKDHESLANLMRVTLASRVNENQLANQSRLTELESKLVTRLGLYIHGLCKQVMS